MAWSEIQPSDGYGWAGTGADADNLETELNTSFRLENGAFLLLEGYPAPTPPTWGSVEPAPSNTWTEI